MKKQILLSIIAISVLFIGCSDNKETQETLLPPGLSIEPDFIFLIPDAEYLPDYESVMITHLEQETKAYPLHQFINFRDSNEGIHGLYFYQLLASDGYTPRVRSDVDYDLSWEQFSGGFLLPDFDYRAFFPEFITSAFNVKFMDSVLAHRGVVVVRSDNSEVIFQLGAMQKQEFQQGSEVMSAVKLSDLISTYVTKNPKNFVYEFYSTSQPEEVYSWDELLNGYWILESGHTDFPDIGEGMNEKRRNFSNLKKIVLYTS